MHKNKPNKSKKFSFNTNYSVYMHRYITVNKCIRLIKRSTPKKLKWCLAKGVELSKP